MMAKPTALSNDPGFSNCRYTMMAKPIKTLILRYPMIQFLIVIKITAAQSKRALLFNGL